MSLTVRFAKLNDVEWICGELKKFSEFFGSKIPLYDDREQAENVVSNMIKHHPFWIACQDDKPIGFISGYLTPHPYNSKLKQLSETFWWVRPESRGTAAGKMLLETFIAFGKDNADWVSFTLEEKSPVKDSCLTKRGFKLVERAYLMECV